MTLPAGVSELVARLMLLRGVHGVTLGGSRAIGTARPDSDTDLGVYYDASMLDQAGLASIALEYGGVSSGSGGWGPWVDGGAWLTVGGAPVDVILRDIVRVREQCVRARQGLFRFHAQPGHPLGFLDVAYAGEVAVGVPLADPRGALDELKALVAPYPTPLRDAFVENVWQVDFVLDGAEKGATTGDVAYVGLCLVTSTMLLAHGWHAVAGSWVLNEKGLVPRVARLDVDSRGFASRAAVILAAPGATPDELHASIAMVRDLPRPS